MRVGTEDSTGVGLRQCERNGRGRRRLALECRTSGVGGREI
jgi:hypothetical protein